jgi:hypothetical protein
MSIDRVFLTTSIFFSAIFSISGLLCAQQIEYIDNNYNSFLFSDQTNLWISSQGGWNRYDGIRTYHYLMNDSLSGLKGEWIQSGFFEGDQGRLWTCSYDHLCYFEPAEDIFTCFQPTLNHEIVGKGIRLLGVDEISDYPIILADSILCYYNTDLNKCVAFKGEFKTNVPLLKVVNQDPYQIIGFGSIENQLVERWNKFEELWSKSFIDFNKCNAINTINVLDVIRLDDQFFMATNKGMLQYDSNNACESKILLFQNEYFKSYSLIVKEHYLVLSTDKFGLLFFDTKAGKWVEQITVDHPIIPLSNKQPVELFDVGNDLMISYRYAKPQFLSWPSIFPLLDLQKNFKSNQVIEKATFEGKFGVVANRYGDFEIYTKNSLWDRLTFQVTGSIQEIQIVNNNLYIHDESSIWLYDLENKFVKEIFSSKYNTLQKLFFYKDRIFAIINNKAFEIIDRAKYKIIDNTINHNVTYFNFLSDSTSLLFTYNEFIFSNKEDTLKHETGSYFYDLLYKEPEQEIYLGLGNGLGIYNIGLDSFYMSELQGIRVNNLLQINNESILASTSEGAFLINDKQIIRLPIQKQEIDNAFVKDSMIYLVTNAELECYPLSILYEESLIDIKVSSSNHSPQREGAYKYTYEDKPLELSILTNDYRSNLHGSYSYSLLEKDYEIENLSFKDALQLPFLPPGEYKLEIYGKDYSYQPLSPVVLQITITGPIWLQWWFILILCLIVFFVAWYYSSVKTKRIRRQMEVVNEIRNLERSALQAQMNPHFIFNCLNSIQNFIMENDKVMAMEYLGRFAKLIRLTLKSSAESQITLFEEVTILDNYLSLEKLRMNHTFDFQIKIEDDIDPYEVEIAPMLIQPFVENAVIHGMKDLEKSGLIKIDFKKKGDDLLVQVKDNGQANNGSTKSPEKRKSYGVSITKKRLDHINQFSNSSLDIQHSEQGTCVTIEIKLA